MGGGVHSPCLGVASGLLGIGPDTNGLVFGSARKGCFAMRGDDALRALLAALPRCCACEVAVAVLTNSDRWPLCEACWVAVPSSDVPPLHDMRAAVLDAIGSIPASRMPQDGP